MKTHQERAEEVAATLGHVASVPGLVETPEAMARAIYHYTYPAELVKVARALLEQVEADHEHLLGDHEGCLDSPEIMDLAREARDALALYEETP